MRVPSFLGSLGRSEALFWTHLRTLSSPVQRRIDVSHLEMGNYSTVNILARIVVLSKSTTMILGFSDLPMFVSKI